MRLFRKPVANNPKNPSKSVTLYCNLWVLWVVGFWFPEEFQVENCDRDTTLRGTTLPTDKYFSGSYIRVLLPWSMHIPRSTKSTLHIFQFCLEKKVRPTVCRFFGIMGQLCLLSVEPSVLLIFFFLVAQCVSFSLFFLFCVINVSNNFLYLIFYLFIFSGELNYS